MKITYFYRNSKVGFSIKKVSDLFVCKMNDREVYEMPSQYASLKGVLANMMYTYKHRNKTGINHITGDVHYCVLPLLFCKTVLTVHDTVLYERSKGIKRLVFKYLWYKLPFKFASRIVCISDCTRQSIKRFTNRDDICVIGNAVDPQLVKAEREFNEANPHILLIGTNWNKNVTRTAKALAGLRCQLTIIGKLSVEQKAVIEECKLNCVNKYGLSDSQIKDEYVDSDIVSFCSTFEGFGMPIIEANAVGRPVITSDLSPMKEVAGGSALLVNPYDISDIRSKFVALMSNGKLRSWCVERGYVNADKYSQASVVESYMRIYKELTKNKE